jgi:peptide/nickel transport system permease protein
MEAWEKDFEGDEDSDQPVDVAPLVVSSPSSQRRASLGLVSFLSRRLLFIGAVAFAIVYFCMLGMSLRSNSITSGEPRSAVDLAVPALEDTFDYFEDLFRGDLGYTVRGVSQRTRVEVAALLAETYVQSGQLLVVAVGLAAIVGILAGGLAASWRHSPLSFSTLTLTIIGVSVPSFFLALLLRVADIAFYRRTGMGLVPVFGSGMDRTQSLLPHLTFPALVLSARPLAHITRVTFVSLSEVLERDFIRTARAKGLAPRVVFWRHALRNVGVSVLTASVVSLRFALGSLPVVEIFFEWPGMGFTMLSAIGRGEVEVVATLGLSLGLTFLLITLLLDLVYRLIDPRLRMAVNGEDL